MRVALIFLAIAILGAAAFFARSDYWIVPHINRWQANLLGDNKYFPVLTVFILALPPLFLIAVITRLLQHKKSNTSH